MIFFQVPSVNQEKPELLFGNDDHYGFIKTLIGEKYDREKIATKCKIYYGKKNKKYWDQIITFINFLAFKKLNEKLEFQDIPLLSLVAEEYDKGNELPGKILFDYFLCQWQYPHPINTTQKIKEKDIELSKNELRDFKTTKPYSSILTILLNLHKENPNQSYLSNDEFYWVGLEFYKSKGEIFQKNRIRKLTDDLLKMRKSGGWNGYKELNNKGNRLQTHLSYPKGFLRNSILLSDEKSLYPDVSNLFIGLNLYASKNIKLVKNVITETDKTKFDWERDRKNDDRLAFEYSDYLYSNNNINKWLSNINIYQQHKSLFDNIPSFDREYDQDEYRKLKVEDQLKRISVLDKETITRVRTEQNILRYFLFPNPNDDGECSICHNKFPIKFLTCAHIKKRKDCNDHEKKDKNVVMPACKFGCDNLYEEGYIIVKEGIILKNITDKLMTSDLLLYLDKVEGNNCLSWKRESEKYFRYHENKQT